MASTLRALARAARGRQDLCRFLVSGQASSSFSGSYGLGMPGLARRPFRHLVAARNEVEQTAAEVAASTPEPSAQDSFSGLSTRFGSKSATQYSVAMEQAVYARNYDAVFDAFEEMKATGVAADQRILLWLVLAAQNRMDPLKSIEFVKELAETGVRPSIYILNTILKGARYTKTLEPTLKVLELMDTFRLMPNMYTFRLTMSACARHGDFQRVEQLLTQMERMAMQPERYTLLEVITLCRPHGNYKLAVSLVKAVDELIPADAALIDKDKSAYDAAFDLALAANAFDDAVGVFRLAAKRKLYLDRGSYTAILNHAARTQDAQLAEDVWASMQEGGITPSRAAYHAIAAALAPGGRLPAAFRALLAMETANMQIAHPLVRKVAAAAAASVDQLDRAFYTLVDAHNAGEAVAISAINSIVLGSSRLGDIGRAVDTFESISSTFGKTPNTESYTVLLEGYDRSRNHIAVRNLIDKMTAEGIPTDSIRVLTFRLFAECGLNRLEEAQRTFDAMLSIRKPPVDCYVRLIQQYLWRRSETCTEVAKQLLHDLVDAGYFVPHHLRERCHRMNITIPNRAAGRSGNPQTQPAPSLADTDAHADAIESATAEDVIEHDSVEEPSFETSDDLIDQSEAETQDSPLSESSAVNQSEGAELELETPDAPPKSEEEPQRHSVAS